MQYVIIGGGIGGLYAALQLIEQHNISPKNICMDIIKKALGKDATHMFDYIAHPAYVMNILEDMLVI